MDKPKRIIYPPVWLVIGLILVFMLDQYFPLARFTGGLAMGVGTAAIVLGLLLLVLAGGSFKQADTDMIPFREVSALVTGGVYRVSRNPMYLGMALILLGTACTTGVASALAVPVLFMVIIEIRFIRPEEVLLREQFGEDFEAYSRQVRRWV